MTLSDVVRTCINEALSAQLEGEWTAGPSNRVDFSGVSSRHGRIRVELERRREDPVNNVVKAWRQACRKPEESFTLVHVFSGYYSSRRAKRDNARFVGERMNEWAEGHRREIRYQAVSFDFEPPPGDSDPHLSNAEAQQICVQICRQLNSNVPDSLWKVGSGDDGARGVDAATPRQTTGVGRMSIAGEILAAARELAGPNDTGSFTRKMIRDRLGVDKKPWDSSYSPIFQGMRDDHPGRAPNPGSAYSGVFHRIGRGEYRLTAKASRGREHR